MESRPLHGTDIRISRLGLGTVKFGRTEQVKYPEPFELPTDAQIHQLLDTAHEGGINFLDTAPAYGLSEERLGGILAERSEEWVLGTKAGEDFVDGRSHHDFSAAGIRSSVTRSLKRLRRERLELVLLHSDGNDLAILNESGAVETLTQLKESGLIGAIGISTKTVEGGQTAFALGLDIVMATYNPWYRDEEPVLDTAASLGRNILIKKALGSGWLGKTPEIPIRDQVRSSFEFILGHPGATAIVVGTLKPDNLRMNCDIVRALPTGPAPD